MATLDKLFSPQTKARLTPAVYHRYACRVFGAPLSMADWSALSYAAGRYRMPGARLALTRVDEALFAPDRLNGTRISGCTAVAAVIADRAVPRSQVLSGFLGEALSLEAAALGLGCCWVTEAYRASLLSVPLKTGEEVRALIALGWPLTPQLPARQRMPLTVLCQGDLSAWPEEAQKAADLVREAPSTMNLQPWRMRLENNRFILSLGERDSLETGIAIAHADLAFPTPSPWRLSRGAWENAAWRDVGID